MKIKMKIGVTARNKIKVDAVKKAYESIRILAEITGYSSPSNVGEQPVNDLTLIGARNRITYLLENIDRLDRIVSIENGIFLENGCWIDRAVVVILNTHNRKEHIAYSDGVEFPIKYVEIAKEIGFERVTVGKVMADYGYVTYSKDPHKSISGISRGRYIEDTVAKLVREIGG
jgi:non-canonical (house-cleaning) NTP pyrophosphatase